MRSSRAQSRNSRSKSPLTTLPTNTGRKSTKLPLISGVQDEPGPNFGTNNSGLVVGVCTQQGKRPYQEDEFAIRPYLNHNLSVPEGDREVETHFFGLFDGHAGGKCSSHVSVSLANVLAEDSLFVSNLPQALKRSFHTTNEQFLKIAEKMKLHDGSTGIVAIVRDRKVLVANVGDCRALIISAGRPIQMSIDQKPTNPDEQKRIAALGGTVVYCMGVARVNRVLAVSRAFGNRTLRQVIRPDAEMMQRDLTLDDEYLVMASDGLWDVLKNKDVCDVCYSPFLQQNPQSIADELVQTALMRGTMDNVTCIVVKLKDYIRRILSENKDASTGSSHGGPSQFSHTYPEKPSTAGSSLSFGALNGSYMASTMPAPKGIERANSTKAIPRHEAAKEGAKGIPGLYNGFEGNSKNGATRYGNNNTPLGDLPNKQYSLGALQAPSDMAAEPKQGLFKTPAGGSPSGGSDSEAFPSASSGSGVAFMNNGAGSKASYRGRMGSSQRDRQQQQDSSGRKSPNLWNDLNQDSIIDDDGGSSNVASSGRGAKISTNFPQMSNGTTLSGGPRKSQGMHYPSMQQQPSRRPQSMQGGMRAYASLNSSGGSGARGNLGWGNSNFSGSDGGLTGGSNGGGRKPVIGWTSEGEGSSSGPSGHYSGGGTRSHDYGEGQQDGNHYSSQGNSYGSYSYAPPSSGQRRNKR